MQVSLSDDVLSLPQAQRELNLSRSYLYKLVKSGKLKATQVDSRWWIISRTSIEEFKKWRRFHGRNRT